MGADQTATSEGERSRGPLLFWTTSPENPQPREGDLYFDRNGPPGVGVHVMKDDRWEKIATAKASVWTLLSDEKWHTTMEINAVDVGGSEGCRRLRELRAKVLKGKYPHYKDIEATRIGGETTQWKYRLVRAAPWES